MTDKSISGPQNVGSTSVTVDLGRVQLSNPLPASYPTYRTIAKHPTVALARHLSMAPILAGSWSVESDDDVDDLAVDFVQEMLIPLRDQFLKFALRGVIDYGWQGFEKVTVIEKWRDGYVMAIQKLKPLLHDITEVLHWSKTGQFAGYLQSWNMNQVLDEGQVVHVVVHYEGTMWHGESLLENIRSTHANWVEANDGARRYDKKVAGSHWVVYYPPGKTELNGVLTSNAVIAAVILGAMESSGSVSVPTTVEQYMDTLSAAGNQSSWKIELLSAPAQQPSFNDRLKYLDTNMVRGLVIPERAVLEGQYGTKAEAGIHGDLAMTFHHLVHGAITQIFDDQVVGPVMRYNFGMEVAKKVHVKASVLVDENKTFMRQIYTSVLSSQQGQVEEMALIDTDRLKDDLGIPKRTDVAQMGEGQGGEPLQPGVDPNDPNAGVVQNAYAQNEQYGDTEGFPR